ncbi:MAG: hypothetical protein PHS34_08910 [Candidatus Omnitrophica bacterium]|nr:hypothetical protein [Candidatus Omnitrophota bacterium]
MITGKILGQDKTNSNGALYNLYQVPVSTQAQFSLYVCNQHTTNMDYFRIALSTGGSAAIDVKEYIFYNCPLEAGESMEFKFILDASKYLVTYSTNGYISFNAIGLEIS